MIIIKTILFSCIGNTDPINLNNYCDGPMLHIARHYKPDMIYLYLSKKMLDTHSEKNIYISYLKDLEKDINKRIDVKIIGREDLTDPSDFEKFYVDFRNLIENIHYENPESKILLNVSSGTPAMKSTLQVLSAFFPFETFPIQVKTPKVDTHYTPIEESEADWEVVMDWNPDKLESKNRCEIVPNKNFNFEIKVDLIKQFVDTYDYNSAYNIALSLKELINPEALEYLRFQKYRKDLDIEGAKKSTKNVNLSTMFYIKDKNDRDDNLKNDDIRTIYEFFLKWQSLARNEEYNSFVINISPLTSALQKRIIEKYVNNQRRINDNPKWTSNLFAKEINIIIENLKEDGMKTREYVSSGNFNSIIQNLYTIPEFNRNCLQSLKNSEDKVRNIFAHQIVPASKQNIEKEMGMSIEELINSAWNLICDLEPKLSNPNVNFKNAYDEINSLIKPMLVQKSIIE